MAIDTLVAYVGVYDSVEAAEADYQVVKELHTKANLIDGYDAAVVERRDGKTKIVKKHETPTRVGGVLGGGVGLATGLVVALFPFAAVGGGLLVGTAAGGAILGAVAGHAAAGMSRDDLKQLGEHLDSGQAGLVVVAVADMGAKVEKAMERASKLEQKQLEADAAEIERDAAAASDPDQVRIYSATPSMRRFALVALATAGLVVVHRQVLGIKQRPSWPPPARTRSRRPARGARPRRSPRETAPSA